MTLLEGVILSQEALSLIRILVEVFPILAEELLNRAYAVLSDEV